MKILKVFTNQYFWLAVIIFFGLLTRLYKIDSPIADWHSWRQADTAAVTRNFVKEGFTPLTPKYDDMSGVSEKPIVNPARFRFVEFPIYNIVVYPFYLLFGVKEVYHRLVSVFFSLGSIALLYFICKKYLGIGVALLIAAAYSLLPFNVFFSRATLPEPTFLFFALGMMYFMGLWIEEERGVWGILGYVFTAIAFLIKPWAVFFFLPLLYLVWVRDHTKRFWVKFIILTALALVPFALWRMWILQQPEGIPASNWLLNGDGIRFRPAFWWWLVSERIGREILGVTGLALFTIGLLLRPKNGNYVPPLAEGKVLQASSTISHTASEAGSYFMHIWALSLFLYMAVFATGNVRHNYYQYIFVPVAMVFFIQGFLGLITGIAGFLPRFWTIILGLMFFLFSFYFTWLQVKGFYQINNPVMIEAGRTADRILPKNAVVLAPYNGDTAFLYQTNRPGFAAEVLPLQELIADFGVNYYVTTVRDGKTNWVIRHFEVLEDNPGFVIADLTKLKKPFEKSDPEP